MRESASVVWGLLLKMLMPTLALTALFASTLDPVRAWSDRAGWERAPEVKLAGVDGVAAVPARMRARWNDEWLFFEFVCRDETLVSPGKKDGEDHFRLGDVVEVFVARGGKPDYLEVHATPAGRKSVYAFRGYRQETALPVGCAVRAGKSEGGWRAVLSIPRAALGGGDEELEFLAGRYDYDKVGGCPVLSSFPAQRGQPDFHDRARFARLELQR